MVNGTKINSRLILSTLVFNRVTSTREFLTQTVRKTKILLHACLGFHSDGHSRKIITPIASFMGPTCGRQDPGVGPVNFATVITSAIASQITGVSIVYSTVCLGVDKRKENTKALRHWPLWGEFTGDRWIPRTKGEYWRKCFHFMTSSLF